MLLLPENSPKCLCRPVISINLFLFLWRRRSLKSAIWRPTHRTMEQPSSWKTTGGKHAYCQESCIGVRKFHLMRHIYGYWLIWFFIAFCQNYGGNLLNRGYASAPCWLSASFCCAIRAGPSLYCELSLYRINNLYSFNVNRFIKQNT